MPGNTTCAGVAAGTKTDKRQRSRDELSGKDTDYCYASAGQLTKAATIGGPTYTYGYDKNGNRKTDASGTHTFNAADQLTDAGTVYDADGNMTASTAYPNIVYNSIGQTNSITPVGQNLVPFSYTGKGQAERTSAGITTAQNGGMGVQTETTGGAITSYIGGPGGKLVTRTPTGDYYYYFDGLGSVIGLVDPSGTQRAQYTYDPYGANPTATAVNGTLPPNPWRWAGGYLDSSTGLYHFGARYYDPNLGRFTQVDPVEGGSCTDYDYGCGDPVNNTDLDGMRSCKWNHPSDCGKAALNNKLVRGAAVAITTAAVCSTGVGCLFVVGAAGGAALSAANYYANSQEGGVAGYLATGMIEGATSAVGTGVWGQIARGPAMTASQFARQSVPGSMITAGVAARARQAVVSMMSRVN